MRDRGLQPWSDREQLGLGDPWQLAIKDAIRTSGVVVFLLSGNSSGSGQTFDMQVAVEATWDEPKWLVPVLVGDTYLPAFLRQYQGIQLEDDPSSWDALVNTGIAVADAGGLRWSINSPDGQ